MSRNKNGARPEQEATAEQAAQMFAQTLGDLLFALGLVDETSTPMMNGGALLDLARGTIEKLVNGELILASVELVSDPNAPEVEVEAINGVGEAWSPRTPTT